MSKFCSLVPINTRQYKDYYCALDVILRHYNSVGFVVTVIHCNREYQGMMEKIKDELNVDMNYTNMDNHIPEAEQNIHTIKE